VDWRASEFDDVHCLLTICSTHLTSLSLPFSDSFLILPLM
jgi:hypothetical protein